MFARKAVTLPLVGFVLFSAKIVSLSVKFFLVIEGFLFD